MAEHYFANDGSDWKTPPSPVSSTEARAADQKALDANDGEFMKGVRPQHTILEGSESPNGQAAGGREANGA